MSYANNFKPRHSNASFANKEIILSAIALIFTLGVFVQQKVNVVIKFNVEANDFGKIKNNVPAVYTFEITNINDKPVVVENSWASCGCTTPDKIVDSILPGATAKLKVSYNAATVASFHKDVFVKLAGIEETKSVQISGEVLSAKAYDALQKEKGEKAKTKN